MNTTSRIARRAVAPVIAVLLAGGCMVGPDYKPPQTTAPASWSAVTNSGANAGTHLTTNAVDLAQWWTKFQDPKLTELVEIALGTNLDIQIAQARLQQARASRGITAGGLWPSLTASGSGTWSSSPRRGSGKSYSAGLNALWEADIFGGTRRGIEAAEAGIVAAQENIHDVQVALAANVALGYILVRSEQEQIAIAKENLQAQQHTADLTRDKLRAGFVSGLDVANADAQVATTASAIPELEAAEQHNIFALGVLLNRPPEALLDELSQPGPVPLTPPEVPVGLPSDLLRRRPDVREAEANLHAAAAQIGVAESAFFPQFTLTGSVNYNSDLLRTVLAGGNRISSFGPQINWPIFAGGSTLSSVRLQKALHEESYLNYRKTVLTALDDVESALVAFAKEWEHRDALTTAVDNNRRALNFSQQLYQQGTADFLTVLDAERSVYGSETALAQSKQAISTDLVTLYQALGGGWVDAK